MTLAPSQREPGKEQDAREQRSRTDKTSDFLQRVEHRVRRRAREREPEPYVVRTVDRYDAKRRAGPARPKP